MINNSIGADDLIEAVNGYGKVLDRSDVPSPKTSCSKTSSTPPGCRTPLLGCPDSQNPRCLRPATSLTARPAPENISRRYHFHGGPVLVRINRGGSIAILFATNAGPRRRRRTCRRTEEGYETMFRRRFIHPAMQRLACMLAVLSVHGPTARAESGGHADAERRGLARSTRRAAAAFSRGVLVDLQRRRHALASGRDVHRVLGADGG